MNIALAKLWRDECLANHSLCGLGSPDPELAPLPTRLLDVTNPEKPVLKEIPSGTTGTYVALSYCWGQVTQLETTRGNYLSHKRGILSSRLPQTIRDAVSVANWLGYKHIWIDALCIIQDDDSDMRRELDKMGDIYRYAALTISAQRAASSHGGLFNK
ncbi:heterokaryon incompatibility protein-domain-containing protein, partial [Bombardia bombarda]